MSGVNRTTFWRRQQTPVKRSTDTLRGRAIQSMSRKGFTLVEVLVASALILMIMLILIQVFAAASSAVTMSRNLRERDSRVEVAMNVLRNDLEGITLVPRPPHDPANGEGYLEIEENSLPDFEKEDGDDVLAFTTKRDNGEMFQGRYGYEVIGSDTNGIPILTPNTVQSDTAEVIYFLRDGVLYRRQLLVVPSQPERFDFPRYKIDRDLSRKWGIGGEFLRSDLYPYSWYGWFDISAQSQLFGTGFELTTTEPVINTLSSLTDRANRYAHFPLYPHRALGNSESGTSNLAVANLFHQDNDFNGNSPWVGDRRFERWFGRPLLVETAHPAWDWPGGNQFKTLNNFWYDPPVDQDGDGEIDITWAVKPDEIKNLPTGKRIAEDRLLTRVLSFDVKVYDPGAPLYGEADHGEGDEEEEHHGEVVFPPYDYNRNGRVFGARHEISPEHGIVGFGAYVDLGYGMNYQQGSPDSLGQLPLPMFNPSSPYYAANYGPPALFWHNGSWGNGSAKRLVRTYDTWSTRYENDGIDQNEDGIADSGTNGIDDNGNGQIDEGPDGLDNLRRVSGVLGSEELIRNGFVDENVPGGQSEHEWEAPAPYAAPLRGIQIRIRVFDETTNRAKEYVLTHDF